MRDEEEVSNDNNEELDDDSDDDDDDDDDNNSFIKNDHESDSVPDESSDDEGIDNSLIKDTETMADFFKVRENVSSLTVHFTNLFSSSAGVSASNASIKSFLHNNEISFEVAIKSTAMYTLFLDQKNNKLLAAIVRSVAAPNGRNGNKASLDQFVKFWLVRYIQSFVSLILILFFF